ncbi:MAG: hypothetical protein HYV27_07630 [Candidatus Hydrogenedentes bacterium]|nr:hypothetical protein [Candidatus Hydrogenedentota bacterium]
MRFAPGFRTLSFLLLMAMPGLSQADAAPTAARPLAPPKTIAYSATPNAYFNDHAADAAQLYDGFFFVAGTWDTNATENLGLNAAPGAPVAWHDLVRENLAHLNAAGATENLLGVYFSDAGTWPSPETLLDPAATESMTAQFAAIAASAKDLGFRGICVDLEYPYPRYALDHAIYGYEDYTAEDLTEAAETQARAITSGMLKAWPDAVIVVLPGALWVRPLARAFQLGMLEAMAEHDAPGGLHFFTERSYGLLDPVSQAAIPRETDLAILALVQDPAVRAYWSRRCSAGPGVWPLHMLETGGKDYPVRPWSEELEELGQQMRILRAVARRYVWSYSANPLWHPYTPEIAQQYQLGVAPFPGVEEFLPGWRRILQDREPINEPQLLPLIAAAWQLDQGVITPESYCDRFGTPAQWLILGPLSNPFDNPAWSAPRTLLKPLRLDRPVAGRDSMVRWFPFKNYEPLGSIRIMPAFEWFKTDMASVQLVSDVESESPVQALLHLAWDDGAAVWLNGALIFDQRSYPERGHGMLYRDRYDFETQVPIALPQGKSRLAVLSINQKGGWGVNLRITDKDGWPLSGLRFSLPQE